jgi:hypothetical protein
VRALLGLAAALLLLVFAPGEVIPKARSAR